MPVLMIPAWLAPRRYSCRGGAVCEPYSVGAPSRLPWIRLGRMSGRVLPVTFGTIRFHVPRVAPGRYKVFVYCEPCYRGRRGSLLTDDRIFRVVRAGSDGKGVVYPGDRLSFVLPSGWHVTSARINGVVDPVTIFTATSFGRRHPRPSAGICSVTLQRPWHVRGAYVQLAEERDGASRKRMLRRLPPRPRHFETRQAGAGGLCTPAAAARSRSRSAGVRSTSSTGSAGAHHPPRGSPFEHSWTASGSDAASRVDLHRGRCSGPKPPFWPIGMDQLWNRGDATGGKRSGHPRRANGLN
jgi:hypothetical protein